jgi:hypothetical protein
METGMSYDAYWDFEWLDDDREQRRRRQPFRNSNIGGYHVDGRGWDSEAEREFAQAVAKYVAAEVTIEKGQNCPTPFGKAFRPDMLIRGEDRVIGIEVDGSEYHKNQLRDELRDAILLRGQFVTCIYRFAASRTWFRQDDCIYVLARYEKRLFDQRAREVILPRLATPWLTRIESVEPSGFERFSVDGAEFCEFEDFSDADDPYPQPKFFKITRHCLQNRLIARTIDWIDRVIERRGVLPFPKLEALYQDRRKQAAG